MGVLDGEVSELVQCPKCGARNRIPPDRLLSQARCGKCKAPLQDHGASDKGAEAYVYRCPECRTRNRIFTDKLDAGAICGKCRSPLRSEELFLPQPLTVTDANFEAVVMKSPMPVLLFAWAPWCPTCNAFLPGVDAFGQEARGRVRVGKVNVDQNPQLSSRFSILSVPQIFIFDGGDLKETLPGAMQKHEIMMKMARYL